MATPSNPSIPSTPPKSIKVQNITRHFHDGVKENVAEDLQAAAFGEVCIWSPFPGYASVCEGDWYIVFTNFIMVGTNGDVVNALGLHQHPHKGSWEVLKNGTITGKRS